MPAHRKPIRAIVLQVPLVNPYAKAKSKSRDSASTSDTSISNPTQPSTSIQPSDPSTSGATVSSSTLHIPASTTTSGSTADAAAPSSSSTEPPPTALDDAHASTAQWNSLLIWARKRRGPQWDAGTGMWQVARESRNYYSFGSDPSQGVEAEKPSDQVPNNSGRGAQVEEDGSPPPVGPGRGVGRGRWRRDRAGQD